MKSLLLAPVLLLVAGAAQAEDPPERSSTVVVYGSDPCPKGEEDEVVVCARRPEGERYRIPRDLRHRGEAPSETSWVARNEAFEEVNRATMPGSCSVVGSYGQSGCYQQQLRQWYAERRSRKDREP